MRKRDARAAPKFPLGRIVATRGALAAISNDEILSALTRHMRGDWGTPCRADWELNERALRTGGRLFSVYYSASETKFYVITEWDRSFTTVLLPREYPIVQATAWGCSLKTSLRARGVPVRISSAGGERRLCGSANQLRRVPPARRRDANSRLPPP